MTKNLENITAVEIDLDNLPPLSDAQQAELAALAARPDYEISYSDIPPLTNLKQFRRPLIPKEVVPKWRGKSGRLSCSMSVIIPGSKQKR